MPRHRRSTVLVLVLALPSAATAPVAAQDTRTAKGRQLAETLCATCHMGPEQGEKQGPMGVPGFAAVASRPGQTHAGVVRWLLSVPAMMPNHHLTRDEADALAAYIMTLRRP